MGSCVAFKVLKKRDGNEINEDKKCTKLKLDIILEEIKSEENLQILNQVDRHLSMC